MPYLPPTPTTATAFPAAYGTDLDLQLRMIEEQYGRFFPALSYYAIRKAVTAGATPDAVVGAAGTTQFDALWGEPVAPALHGQPWRQPHLSGDLPVDDVEVRDAAVEVRGDVQRTARESDLKRWGFEKVREVLITVPTLYLDRYAVTATEGDKVVWGGVPYWVWEAAPDGWWQNSNVPLYVVLNCGNARRGS